MVGENHTYLERKHEASHPLPEREKCAFSGPDIGPGKRSSVYIHTLGDGLLGT